MSNVEVFSFVMLAIACAANTYHISRLYVKMEHLQREFWG